MTGYVVHIILVVAIAGITAGLEALQGASPGALVVSGVSVVPMLLVILRALRLDPPAVQAEKKAAAKRLSVPSPPPLALLTMAILIAFAVGCSALRKAEPPLADFAVCVFGDAANGRSLLQIALDCNGSLEQVVVALLTSEKPEVRSSRAFGEARALGHTFAAHPELAAGP